MRNLIRT